MTDDRKTYIVDWFEENKGMRTTELESTRELLHPDFGKTLTAAELRTVGYKVQSVKGVRLRGEKRQ
jgi:hypothetical protein